jgi:pimeloyl-ACP methyl ester carboxylesterase
MTPLRSSSSDSACAGATLRLGGVRVSGSATVDAAGEPPSATPPPARTETGPDGGIAVPTSHAALRASIFDLAGRFRPQEAAGLRARWLVRIIDHGAYTVEVAGGRCSISVGALGEPDATVETDAETWLDLAAGRRDGVAAFCAGRLTASGDLNLALRLDTLFRPGRESRRLMRTTHTVAHGVTLESFVAGRGTPVILLHGLAASKVSFLPTVDGLADHHEVHALDLPGFGKSEKPLPAGRRYHARWMADAVHAYIRANHLRHAHLIGNSMGGRIAVELALRHPRRVLSVSALGAAVAFDEWQWAGVFLRRLQGHWVGLAPMPLRPSWIEAGIADLFADPTCLPPGNLAAAAAEVARQLRSPRHRLAIAACARHIAAERATGRRSFWSRLERLRVPSYWIWGREDRLSACRYADRIRSHVRDARVEVWDGVGHVPQFEAPDRTNAALLAFLTALEERWKPTV